MRSGGALAAVDREALALDRVDVLPDGDHRHESHVGVADDRDAVEVEVHPADGADLADAQAGAEREADQVGHVRADGRPVGVDVGEQASAFFGGEAARGRLAVALRRLDALQLADRVRRDRLVEEGLLQHTGDDRAVDASSVGRVEDLLRCRAVLVLDDSPAALKSREEGIHLRHVALAEAQFTELRKDELLQPIRVGGGG
jgi:hypothetical protein